MCKKLKIIAISISFLFCAQESYDEIDYLISFDNQYLFLPNRIEKIESLWYVKDSDSLFTGRIEIFIMNNKKTIGQVLNVGSNKKISISYLCNEILKITNIKKKY